MPQLVLRRFQPSDGARVWELHQAATSGAEAFEADDYFRDLREIESRYIETNGEFLVGVIDNHVVAMGGFIHRGEAVGEILRMRVDPAHQRSGFATAVLKALEHQARDRGIRKLILQTTAVQIAAQRFYESQRFVETGRGSEDGYEVIRYEKQIA